MNTEILIQSTPNPNALKFVLNVPVKTEGNYTYKNAAQCQDNPLAKAIFDISPSIIEVYFFDNYITVTQNGSLGWNTVKNNLQSVILAQIKTHDPNFPAPKDASQSSAAGTDTSGLEKIKAILDETVRPALQRDGGDIQVVDYADKNLKIHYQGACGSCPSATMGTLAAIQRILQEQFDPEIQVSLAEPQ